MTAVEIVMKRAGLDEENAAYYVELAEMRVRSHLELDEDESLSKYVFPVSDIATMMWQSDKSTKQSSASLGYESESFSEGGVSRSKKSMNGSVIWGTYARSIQEILDNLDGNAGKVVFL